MQYFRVATSKVTLDIFLWQTFNKYYDNILRLAKQPTGNHIQSRRHPNNRPPPAPTHQQSNQKTPATPPPPPPTTKAKPEESLQQLEARSINAAKTDDNFIRAEHVINQQPINSDEADNQQSMRNGIPNLILPSKKDCTPAPGENPEPNSTGLKSSAQAEEKSMPGHLVYSEK